MTRYFSELLSFHRKPIKFQRWMRSCALLSRKNWWAERSILSRDASRNGFFGGCFQRMATLFVFYNRKPLFKRNEDISSCLRDEILINFCSHFGRFLRSAIFCEEKALRTRLLCSLQVTNNGSQKIVVKPVTQLNYKPEKRRLLIETEDNGRKTSHV